MLSTKDTNRFKTEAEKDSMKRSKRAQVMSDKTYFQAQIVTRRKGRFVLTNISIYQKDIKIINNHLTTELQNS